MYDSSIAPISHSLKALAAILKKAEAYCEAKKIDPNALLADRLFPDMLPLVRQVQIATDQAKGCGARLTGIAVPSYPDEEKTFPELQARIAKTLDFIGGLKREQFADAAKRTVTIKVGSKDMELTGAAYLSNAALPNFYFHVTTAYNILRHNGLEIGKGDFLGRNLN
jgi:uncharacterized protein